MGRRKKGQDIHGWVLLDKPLDLTSTQAVSAVRRLFDAKKAGHAGTLDPLATGMLPIALGEATKTVPFAQDAGKTYRFTIRWGVSTNTLDAEGKETATSDIRPDVEAIRAALPEFVGDIEQIPPKFSAIKIDGARAYDLARAGENVEIAARPVRIDRLDVIDTPSADETVFEMDCGKGTYVRAIARDLSLRLGTEGHISRLRRTAVGVFEESAAISLDELVDLAHKGRAFEGLAPVETALDDIPALALSDTEADRLRSGQAVAILRPQDRERLAAVGDDGIVLAVDATTPVALARVDGIQIRPVRVLNL